MTIAAAIAELFALAMKLAAAFGVPDADIRAEMLKRPEITADEAEKALKLLNGDLPES